MYLFFQPKYSIVPYSENYYEKKKEKEKKKKEKMKKERNKIRDILPRETNDGK